MSTAYMPSQPPPIPAPPLLPPTAPHASEANRLLCTGTYLDAKYRDQVIDELYRREQRVAAPSLGFDAARVLAHALQARRVELAWSAAMLGLLAVGAATSGGWLLVLVLPGLLLTFARWLRGITENSPGKRRLLSSALRWMGWTLLAYLLFTSLTSALGPNDKPADDKSDASPTQGDAWPAQGDAWPAQGGEWPAQGDAPSAQGDASPAQGDAQPTFLEEAVKSLTSPDVDQLEARLALTVMLAMGLCSVGQQLQFIRVLRGVLSPERFPDVAGDPAEQAGGSRSRRLRRRIRIEQHAPLIMYHEARPFCGAGIAHDTWVLSVELRPEGAGERQPIRNDTVLAAVRPFLDQLRNVAEAAEQAGHVVRDRLRHLEIDECVFLPADELPQRAVAPYDPLSFQHHRALAVEEGGEKRRHFLRIRVGGWDEELVVTVFVRVHTQGRMLMLEIAPHVLFPVRADFKDADHTIYRFVNQNALGKAVQVLSHVPGAPGEALVAIGRCVVHNWRRLTGEFSDTVPDGPALSVRELAAQPGGSLFQSMDVDRYLKSVQDRVAYGVKAAIVNAGYRTDEFAQKVVYISNGGINIDSVEGSTFAVGDHARAATTSGGQTPPQRGSADHAQ